jgi:hypothetical protein
MVKSRKQAATPDPPPVPQVGDKVTIPSAKSVLEVTSVSKDGNEVNLQRPGTNLEWFRVRSDTLTFVERKPPTKTSNPFTNPEPVFNASEVLERISTVQQENLQRLDDDIAILTKYLKSEDAPKASISALDGLRIEQHESWKTVVERIVEILEE